MNTSAVIGALARIRAAYSRTINLRGLARLAQALNWSAQELPQLYKYHAAYARLQLFRNRFSATAYGMVASHLAELDMALAP